MPFSVKGNPAGQTGEPIQPNDGATTIDQYNESISGLERERVSSVEFNQALESSNRRPSNGELSYAYSDMRPIGTHPTGKQGAPSLANEYALYYHPRCNSSNDYMVTEGGAYPKYSRVDPNGSGSGGRNITVKSLIDEFNPNDKPSTPLYLSDFIYNKHDGRIPLNRMVTLRRFPFPTYDNLQFASGERYKPLAQAVTYFGEPTGNSLKDLTRIGGYINWQEMEANVHDVDGNETGLDNTPIIPRGVGKLVSLANGKTDLSGRKAADAQAAQRFSDPSYTGRTLGPVNVVNKTHIRDRGIGADQEFSLVFEYELCSYGNINPRVAMLDIMCNMLALTFNNAKFWGGSNRYFPNINQYGFIGDQQAFYSGDYSTYIDSFVTEIGTAAQTGIDVFKSIIRNVFSGNFKDLFSSIARGMGGTMLDLKAAKSRPQVLGFKALLTGEPIGEWHLTIGNPTRPIMVIGNLICTGFEFELGEKLGLDDFPTEMKWTINLKYGRPRDKGDVESMFHDGAGRAYYPPAGRQDALNMSAATETVIRPDNRTNFDNPSSRNDNTYTGIEPDGEKPGNSGRGKYDLEYLKKLEGTVF